jgi:hypothetical protein
MVMFDLPELSADELGRVTAANLRGGGFARVVTTLELLG